MSSSERVGRGVRRGYAVAALLGLLLAGRTAHAFEVETLRDSGPVGSRINIVVLGDGYRTEDQSQLTSDAGALINHLFGSSPFQSYAQFFNVKLVHVISNQNGADFGDFGDSRDTALGSAFNCFGVTETLCVDTATALSVAASDVPEHDLVMVVVNDTKSGGSGGSVLVSSANPASFEVVAHEIPTGCSGRSTPGRFR